MNDILPPDAAFEARTVERLLTVFKASGYEQVKPPLVEFEDSLLGGAGAAMTQQTFRLMDPVSQAMLGLRADMTLQVARIAEPYGLNQDHRGNRPSRQQLVYVAAVMRRQQKIPPISVVRNKRQCSGWLTEHGDWTPGR